MEQKLSQKQSQKMLFTPRMLESMQILKMGLMDLRHLIENEIQVNPLLEEMHREIPPINIRSKGEEIDSSREMNLAKPLSLQENLLRQLRMLATQEEDLIIGEEIIGNIDDDGYLKASPEEIARILNKDTLEVEAMIAIVQNFEPPGVGARSLKECLLIQLQAIGKENSLVWKIVENHLDECGKKQYAKIAKIMDVSINEVKEALKELSKLEPRPGRRFSRVGENHYIVPDIYIKKVGNEYQIISNKFDIPNIRINSFYNNILNGGNSDKETQDYIKGKLKSAGFLIRCIHQRWETIQKITEFVVKMQAECIEKGRSFLKPLTFKDAADAIERHESTISRAIANKYIDTPSGVYELREFFNGKASKDDTEDNGNNSSLSVKVELKDLVDNENKTKPLSDEKLKKIFRERGIKLSRRTIAKYREDLKILPSHLRKT